MNSMDAYSDLLSALERIYENREAENIADWVMEHITGKKKWQRRRGNVLLDEAMISRFRKYRDQLLSHRPVQYVLQEAFFCGMKFFVDDHVLIPRPETEELVKLVCDENLTTVNPNILDIGTGSGCIPISIRKKLPAATVTSIDVSAEALQVAQKNARQLDTDITFQELDFLNEDHWQRLGRYDIIVSNPPYIPETEKHRLDKHVVDFEPAVALFVAESDPLLFYRKIERFGGNHLKPSGKIYLEVHESYAGEVLKLFQEGGWPGRIVKDFYDKDRMIVVEGRH